MTLLSVSLGFAGGAYFVKHWATESEASKTIEDRNVKSNSDLALKRKLAQLKSIDFKEYLQLKQNAEKYEKADELLAKVMLVFLADLGIKLSAEERARLTESASRRPKMKELVEEGEDRLRSGAVGEEGYHQKPRAGADSAWSKAEWKLPEAKNENEVKDFLDQVRIKDYFEALKKSKIPSNKKLDLVRGLYVGQVFHLNKDEPTWDIEMEFSGDLEEQGLQGSLKLKISKNGKVFSNKNSEGSLREIRALPQVSQAILVQGAPDLFFQIYRSDKLQRLVGNYYRKTGEGDFAYKGQLFMERR